MCLQEAFSEVWVSPQQAEERGHRSEATLPGPCCLDWAGFSGPQLPVLQVLGAQHSHHRREGRWGVGASLRGEALQLWRKVAAGRCVSCPDLTCVRGVVPGVRQALSDLAALPWLPPSRCLSSLCLQPRFCICNTSVMVPTSKGPAFPMTPGPTWPVRPGGRICARSPQPGSAGVFLGTVPAPPMPLLQPAPLCLALFLPVMAPVLVLRDSYLRMWGRTGGGCVHRSPRGLERGAVTGVRRWFSVDAASLLHLPSPRLCVALGWSTVWWRQEGRAVSPPSLLSAEPAAGDSAATGT